MSQERSEPTQNELQSETNDPLENKEFDESGAPVFRTPRTVGKIVKWTLVLFVIAVNALLLWRVFFSANIPSELKSLSVNAPLTEAYRQNGESLTLRYQDQLSLSYDKGSQGYFGIPYYVFIPEAEQVQVVFRYNNSTLRNLAKDYGLEEIPDKGTEPFDVTLLKTTDLTPDIANDANDPNAVKNERIHPTSQIRETTALYTYYRFVFDGVTVTEGDFCSIFLDVYYKNDLDYEKAPYGVLRLYDHHSVWYEYELTQADRRAIKNFQNESAASEPLTLQ